MNEPDPAKTTVAFTRCSGYQMDKVRQALQRQFSLLGGLEKFVSRGEHVLLKPNFIAPEPRAKAAQTHPAVILVVAEMLKDLGAKPFLGDSPAWSNMSACVKALEMEEQLKKLDLPVRDFNKSRRKKIAGSRIAISTAALEADKIINLPKLKTHQQLGATFAVKNMYGCVCGKEKAFWHFAKGKSYDDFCKMLIEIYKLLRPAITIIDGIVAMEGMGPINGKARPLGVLVGGADPIACEMLCCEIISLNPEDLPIIVTAEKLAFGCSDLSRIKVVGDDYRAFTCKPFEPAEQTPLRFPFPRICKSTIKQIIILARFLLTGKDK